MVRILLLDDERELREEIADYLRGAGFEVDEAGSLRQFHQQFSAQRYPVVVIDRALPDGDGLDLVEDLRQADPQCGIVVFTARDASQERISGYRRGADHYLTKPIRLEELVAVLESVARRVTPEAQWLLREADWSLLIPGGPAIRLTAQEHALLGALARGRTRALSRSQILEALGKDSETYDPRNLDALVLRLRRKVAEVSPQALPLKAVHGAGYALTQELQIR